MPVTIDGMLGWYRPGRTRRGVVMCGTIGFEQLAAYQRWYALADRFAAAGCAVLRFDYPGEGDSRDVAVQHADTLVGSIIQAADWMREVAGVAEVALVGIRLGATLAALAGPRAGAERVALIAPFVNGRRYNREMEIQASVLGLFADGAPMPQPADHLNVGGFRFDPATAASLAPIDLTAVPAPAPRVLVSGQGIGALATAYAERGAQVTVAPFAELAPVLGRPADAARQPVLDALIGFVAGDAPPAPAQTVEAPRPIGGAGWQETVEEVGGLVAVRCRPEAGPTRAAILLLNAGSNMRSGWGRQGTRLARTLAQDGVTTLRVDLPGIGDSPGETIDDPLAPALIHHVRRFVDALATEGVPIVATGVCSGADLAWRGLCGDARIDAALLVNPPWLDDDVQAVAPAAAGRGFRSTATYWRMLRQPAAWRRLASGGVRIGPIAATVLRRAMAAWARAGRHGSASARLREVRGRGQRIDILFSQGDVGVPSARRALGRTDARIAAATGGVFATVPGTDHNFGGAAGDAAMLDALRSLIDRVVASPRGVGGRERDGGALPTKR